MNILLLASQHGNELLGQKLYKYMRSRHVDLLPHVTFKIANPKAYTAGMRYIESDMNRSYDRTLHTYEAKQARIIESYIKKHQFDCVLDLHTTTCQQPPCFIIEDITDANREFIGASHINKIVLMQHDIVRASLIGRFSQAVSIEVHNVITKQLLEDLCLDIHRYISHIQTLQKRSVYHIQGLLLKSEIDQNQVAKLTNFQYSSAGFVPVLVGENSYKKNTDYLGFKASKETLITL